MAASFEIGLTMGYKVAVVGATGNVGREMLNVLAEREVSGQRAVMRWPRAARSAPRSPSAINVIKCRDLETFDFKGIDFCLMSAGSAVSKEWSPRIGAAGHDRHR